MIFIVLFLLQNASNVCLLSATSDLGTIVCLCKALNNTNENKNHVCLQEPVMARNPWSQCLGGGKECL